MKSYFSKIISVVLFLVSLVLLLLVISKTVQPKNYANTYKPFFEDAEQMDVLLFGTSHMACDVSPMYMWNKYGITSYNFGNASEPIPVTFWEMKMAFQYSSPKVAVLDVGSYTCGEKYNGNGTNDSHLSFDAFPLSKTKMEAVNDLIDNRNTKIEYLLPVGLYHDRWDKLAKDDFVINASKQKGTWAYGNEDRYFIPSGNVKYDAVDEVSEYGEDEVSRIYLNQIMELCKQNGVLLVLVVNPYACNTIEQPYINGVSIIAKENGVPFLNLMKMDSIVDYNTDMMDEQHTNPSGMNKVSDYLGNALSLVVDNHKTDAEYENWNEDYNEFLTLKDDTLRSIRDAKSILEYISDEDYASFVYVDGNSTFWEDDQNISLVQNIVRNHVFDNSGKKSCDINLLTEISNASDNDADYFLAAQGSGEEFTELSGDEDVNSINSIGEFDYYKNDNGGPVLIVHGYDDSVNLFEYEDTKPDVQIVVFNKTTQELIINTKWKMGSNTINQL